MKSFSNFLLEKKPLDITNDPKGGEKFLKNLRKKSVQNQTDVKTVDRPADVQGRMDATDSKKGGYSRVDDTFDNKPSGKRQLGNTTKGGEVRTIRPPDSPSGNESRKLGKLNKRTGKLNFSANKELQAKRKLRVDTTTGKATPKGVENYAQGRGGYGRTTGKPRNMPKAEWESRKAQAKQIASNPSSKAYKDIERKINTSDYAGKRAKGASPTELKSIKSSIANSKTVNAKGGKLNIPRRGNVVPLNTSTRKGKIIKPTVTATKVVKQSEVSKKAAEFTKKTNQLKVSKVKVPTVSSLKGVTNSSPTPSLTKTPTPIKPSSNTKTPTKTGSLRKGNLKFPGDVKNNYKDMLKKIKSTDGRKFNNAQVNINTGKQIPKDIKNQMLNTKDSSGARWSNPGSGRQNYTGAFKPGGEKLNVSKAKGPGIKMSPGAKSYKQFMKSAAPGKTFAKTVSKTLRPSGKVATSLKATKNIGGKILGKAAAPLSGVIDTVSGYNQYRDKGHGKLGSFVRGAIKGAASTAGFVAGGALGALGGGGVASAVTGAAGGLAGSALAGKTADWAIGAFDKVFKPKKNLDPKYKKKIKQPKTPTTTTPTTTSPYGAGWTKVKGSEKKGQVVGTNLQVRQPT